MTYIWCLNPDRLVLNYRDTFADTGAGPIRLQNKLSFCKLFLVIQLAPSAQRGTAYIREWSVLFIGKRNGYNHLKCILFFLPARHVFKRMFKILFNAFYHLYNINVLFCVIILSLIN